MSILRNDSSDSASLVGALEDLSRILSEVHILSKKERELIVPAIGVLRNASGRAANLRFGWIACDAARIAVSRKAKNFSYGSLPVPPSLALEHEQERVE